MTDPFEHLLRSTLSELAEEAPTVHNPLNEAERRVRNRRRRTMAASAAGTLAAVLIGAPFALADRGDDDGRRPQPATSAPAANPTESQEATSAPAPSASESIRPTSAGPRPTGSPRPTSPGPRPTGSTRPTPAPTVSRSANPSPRPSETTPPPRGSTSPTARPTAR